MLNKTRGFLLIEMLIYVVTATIILGAIMYFVVQMYALYAAFTVPTRADRVGMSIAHELAKEIRSGARIDQAESAFGIPAGFITIEAQENASEVTKYFALVDGRIVYRENGGEEVFLTPADLSVSTFRFTQLVSPVSYAVRYEIAITYPVRDGGTETRTYTGLAILRHSYD